MKLIVIFFSILFFSNATANQCSEKNIPLKQFKAGDLAYLEYANGFINIYHRTQDDIKALKENEMLVTGSFGNTNQPGTNWPPEWVVSKRAWATNKLRSINSNYFVFWATTPSNDCNLIHISKTRKSTDGKSYSFLPDSWPGGFLDPCFGVGYNYSGRPIYKALYENDPKLDKRATYNLLVPEYTINNNVLNIQSCPNK